MACQLIENTGRDYLIESRNIRYDYSCGPHKINKLILTGNRCEEVGAAAAVGGGGPVVEEGKRQNVRLRGRGAMNTTKHLWSGAVAAMVTRFVILFYYSIFMVELVCLIV